jgi:hypothetical protein
MRRTTPAQAQPFSLVVWNGLKSEARCPPARPARVLDREQHPPGER